MEVGAVVRDLLKERRISQRKFAAALGLNDGYLSRILDGQTRITVDQVASYEQELGLKPGAILRLAGLCPDPADVREAIELDPALVEAERRIVLRVYDTAVEASAAERAASHKSSPI